MVAAGDWNDTVMIDRWPMKEGRNCCTVDLLMHLEGINEEPVANYGKIASEGWTGGVCD